MELLPVIIGLFRGGPAQPPAARDDLLLVEAIRRGEPDAEAEFAERFRDRVLNVALRRLKDPEAARDVAQETILAALLSLRDGRLNHPERLSAFVFGTARNLINNYVRSSVRRNERALTEDMPAQTDPFGTDFENRTLLRSALATLPPHDQQILRLTLVDQLNPGEIARLLGLRPDVVRARKTRALKRIKRKITSIVTKRRASATQDIRGGA